MGPRYREETDSIQSRHLVMFMWCRPEKAKGKRKKAPEQPAEEVHLHALVSSYCLDE